MFNWKRSPQSDTPHTNFLKALSFKSRDPFNEAITILHESCGKLDPALIKRVAGACFELAKVKDWLKVSQILEVFEKVSETSPLYKKLFASVSDKTSHTNLLHYACMYDAPGYVGRRILNFSGDLKQRANVTSNGIQFTGCSYLHLAVSCCNAEMAEVLLAAGHDLSAKNDDGHNPMLMAARTLEHNADFRLHGAKITKTLAAYGEQFIQRDQSGKSALHYLIESRIWPSAEIACAVVANTATKSAPVYDKSELRSFALCAAVFKDRPQTLLENICVIFDHANYDAALGKNDLQIKCSQCLWGLVAVAKEQSDWSKVSEVLGFLNEYPDMLSANSQLQVISSPGPINGRPLLHELCNEDAPLDCIKSLAKMGYNLNATHGYGFYGSQEFGGTALHVCDVKENLAAAELLISLGINTEAKDEFDTIAFADSIKHFKSKSLTYQEEFVGYPHLFKHLTERLGLPGNPVEFFLDANTPIAIKLIDNNYPIPEHLKNVVYNPLRTTQDPFDFYDFVELIRNNKITVSPSPGSSGSIVKALTDAGNFSAASNLLDQGFMPPPDYIPKGSGDNVSAEVLRNLVEKAKADLLMMEKLKHIETFDSVLRNEAKKFIQESKNVQDSLRYLSAVSSILGNNQDTFGRDLAELLPSLLHHFEHRQISALVRRIESKSDHRGNLVSAKANMVELFALLMHPRPDENMIGALTSAISSLERLSSHNIQVTGQIVNIWTQIANLGLGFRRYRADTERIYDVDDNGKKRIARESLYEKAGFSRLTKDSKEFGASYALLGKHAELYLEQLPNPSALQNLIDPKTVILTNRGIYLVYHPKYGSLVIRNSSLKFGRDLLRYPAYYSDQKFNSDKVRLRNFHELSVKDIEGKDFFHILHPTLYEKRSEHFLPKKKNAVEFLEMGNMDEIDFLLGQLQTVFTGYSKHKFDTNIQTAWKVSEGEKPELLGAYNSPGFGDMVAFIRAKFDEAASDEIWFGERRTQVPNMELYHPYMPPHSPYARIVINDESLRVLEYLVENGWEEPPAEESEDAEAEYEESIFESSGIYEFVQLALSEQAELLLVYD